MIHSKTLAAKGEIVKNRRVTWLGFPSDLLRAYSVCGAQEGSCQDADSASFNRGTDGLRSAGGIVRLAKCPLSLAR
jgi:hypothetical protein